MTCGIEMKMATIWLALILLNSGVAAIHIFLTPGSLPATIPASCRASLAADITCGPRLIHASELENDFPFNATFLSEYCNSTCTTSLNTFVANINTRCGNVDYDFGYNTTQSGNDIAVALKWAHDTACLTGLSAMGTGFCLPGVVNHTAQVCDDCTLKYLAGMLSSEFGARKITPSGYSSLLSSCAVAPTKYPYTTPSSVALPTMTPMPNQTCFGGTYYTIKGGDGCESIAAANNLAIDNFLALNSIDSNCTAIAQGMTVCIRDSCKLYTVQPGDTCKSILAAHSFTMNELVAWNPVLETNCDDMVTMVGRSICISPPGTDSYDVTMTASFDDIWTLPAGSWVTGPTAGTPLGNTTTASYEWSIPTSTVATGTGPAPTQYFANCPIKDEDYDAGFAWELLNQDCQELMSPYCMPIPTGTPLGSTSFPITCSPSYLLADPDATPALTR